MNNMIPKEYYLEAPAKYDEVRIKIAIQSYISVYGMIDIATNPLILKDICANHDHSTVLIDIFCYLIDVADYDVYEEENIDKFMKNLINALYEAGFFA